MMRFPSGRQTVVLAVFGLWSALSLPAFAQLQKYPDPSFDALHPAGGQQGQTVDVLLLGQSDLTGATEIVVDGPPGVTVRDVREVTANSLKATFEIAADAVPGRRRVRILGGLNGLTNWRSFYVGTLPEVMEVESAEDQPQEVTTPVVINGRINPTLDVDEYRFSGKRGEQIVAAVLAHRMDTIDRKSRNYRGFLDTSLELRDASGKILASAEDTLGLDPVLHLTLPEDGVYSVHLQSLSFQGYKQAVYRLTLGAVPYPTAAFPAGGKRGETVVVELSGPNVPEGTTVKVKIPENESFPLQDVTAAGTAFAGHNVFPFARGDFPEVVIRKPGAEAALASQLAFPATVNARFDVPGADHWYRLSLKKGEAVLFQTMAERHLGLPLDTVLEVRDESGKTLAENDDGRPFENECHHDFNSADSWLPFTPNADGDYFLRVRDQGNSAGPRAIYRLQVSRFVPDFELFQWPDAVPVWGPGTTATFVVQTLYSGGFQANVELSVEGLPASWQSSITPVTVSNYPGYNNSNYGVKGLVTITAPVDAAVGTRAVFRVVGRAVQGDRTIEHEAQALTLLGNGHNDRMHFRFSPESYVVVAPPLTSWLETETRELTVRQGGRVQIPVTFHRREGEAASKEMMSVTVDGQTVAVNCAWQPPQAIGSDDVNIAVNLLVTQDRPPGLYGILVSRSWSSDLRGGRPGPCTQLIRLTVLPPE